MGSNCIKSIARQCQNCFTSPNSASFETQPLQSFPQNTYTQQQPMEPIPEYEPKFQMQELTQEKSEELSLIKQKKSDEENLLFEQSVQTIPILNSLNAENINQIGEDAYKILRDRLDYHNDYETVIDEDDMIIWFKSYTTDQKMVISQIKCTFYIDCTLEQYLQFQLDCEQQKELDSKIVEYKRIGGEDLSSLIYVKYKKHLFFDPRECLYIKYIKQNNDDNNYYQICRSVQFDEVEQSSKFVRADNFISGEQIKQESPNRLRINAISEVNMKVKIPAKMTKAITCKEFKKFIQKTQSIFLNKE